MSNLSADIQQVLGNTHASCLIITVGNTLRSDDGIGPYIHSKLVSDEKFTLINAGHTPERIIEEAVAAKPKKVIIIDAADFGGKPGDVRLIDKKHIPETTISTHAISLRVISEILEKDTGAPVHFIGIQPKSVVMGEELSQETKQAAEALINYINTNQRS